MAYDFIKKIKAENVYVNINPCEKITFEVDMENLIYKKKINLK